MVEMSIGELAQAAGVTRRVVRFYVQRELLAAPNGRGRGSYYNQEHLQQLLQIKEWQAAGHSLEAIGLLLQQTGTGATQPAKRVEPESASLESANPESESKASTAATRGLRTKGQSVRRGKDQHNASVSASGSANKSASKPASKPNRGFGQDLGLDLDIASGLSDLLDRETEANGKRPVQRHVRTRAEARLNAELWTRLELAPGAELHLDTSRHRLPTETLKKLKQLIGSELNG